MEVYLAIKKISIDSKKQHKHVICLYIYQWQMTIICLMEWSVQKCSPPFLYFRIMLVYFEASNSHT
jgi:hypothetical protein